MSLVKFHHVNLTSAQVPAMAEFYKSVLEIDEKTTGAAASRMSGDYEAPVAFLESGGVEMHLATMDLGVGHRMKQAINPLARGHIAFRTDDLAAVKANLDKHGIPYSDYGVWAIANWHQIFFYDPAGNIIEVHQVLGDAGSAQPE